MGYSLNDQLTISLSGTEGLLTRQHAGQGGHPPRPAEADLRRQAARGRQDPLRLQHPEGVYFAPGAPSARRCHRADPASPRAEVQRGQDDLPQVLRSSPPQGHQLQEEEVRTHLQHQAEEEAEVNECCGSSMSPSSPIRSTGGMLGLLGSVSPAELSSDMLNE